MSFSVSRKRSLSFLSFADMWHSVWREGGSASQRHLTCNVPAMAKGRTPEATLITHNQPAGHRDGCLLGVGVIPAWMSGHRQPPGQLSCSQALSRSVCGDETCPAIAF